MAGPFYSKGRYRCEVIDQGVGESNTAKTPQVVIRFRVLETEDGEAVQQYDRTIYLYLTEKAVERTVACLRDLGFNGDSFKLLDKTQPNAIDLTGQSFTAFCDWETYNGNDKEKWGIALENQFEMVPADPRKLRELDNLFGKHLKSGAAPTPAPQKRETRRAEPVPAGGITDDDVPF